jgi:DNA-binding IclR family transcriptional regulator
VTDAGRSRRAFSGGYHGTVRQKAEDTESADQRTASGIQIIARIGDIFRTLEATPGGLTQAELGARLGMARSTVHRLLNALADEGLVAVSGSRGRYRLGPEFSRMAIAARDGIVDEIHPFVVRLSRDLNETVDLSILDRDRITFIDQVVAPQRLRAVSSVGESFPLYCTAPGKAILAVLSPAELAALGRFPLSPLTANTITTRAGLQRELRWIRGAGVAYDREEHTEGIAAIGCVVSSAGGHLAAVSVPMPAQRFYGREAELTGAILGCRQAIAEFFEEPAMSQASPADA